MKIKGKNQNKRKKSRNSSLEQVNLNAAGIDIGSKEHYVAVPEDRDEQGAITKSCGLAN